MQVIINGKPTFVEHDTDGTLRFHRNRAIYEIYEASHYQLNHVWHGFTEGKYTLDELMELYQHLGYSLDGFYKVFSATDQGFEPVQILMQGKSYEKW